MIKTIQINLEHESEAVLDNSVNNMLRHVTSGAKTFVSTVTASLVDDRVDSAGRLGLLADDSIILDEDDDAWFRAKDGKWHIMSSSQTTGLVDEDLFEGLGGIDGKIRILLDIPRIRQDLPTAASFIEAHVVGGYSVTLVGPLAGSWFDEAGNSYEDEHILRWKHA